MEFVQEKQKKPQTHQSGKNIEENIGNAPNFPFFPKNAFSRRFLTVFAKEVAFFNQKNHEKSQKLTYRPQFSAFSKKKISPKSMIGPHPPTE